MTQPANGPFGLAMSENWEIGDIAICLDEGEWSNDATGEKCAMGEGWPIVDEGYRVAFVGQEAGRGRVYLCFPDFPGRAFDERNFVCMPKGVLKAMVDDTRKIVSDIAVATEGAVRH